MFIVSPSSAPILYPTMNPSACEARIQAVASRHTCLVRLGTAFKNDFFIREAIEVFEAMNEIAGRVEMDGSAYS